MVMEMSLAFWIALKANVADRNPMLIITHKAAEFLMSRLITIIRIV